MVLKYVERHGTAYFLLQYAPFELNGLKLEPFGPNGLIFQMCPGKAPRPEESRGEETSPHLHVLARPTKGPAICLVFLIAVLAHFWCRLLNLDSF